MPFRAKDDEESHRVGSIGEREWSLVPSAGRGTVGAKRVEGTCQCRTKGRAPGSHSRTRSPQEGRAGGGVGSGSRDVVGSELVRPCKTATETVFVSEDKEDVRSCAVIALSINYTKYFFTCS